MEKIKPLEVSFYSDLKERQEYNDTINKIPSRFKDYYLPNKILVRLFKFTNHTTTEGGVITPKMVDRHTEGGRPKAMLDKVVYQNRGIVVYISPEIKKKIEEDFEYAEKFKEGAIVWVDPKTITNPFLHSPEHPIQMDTDFILANPHMIQNIESDTLPIEFI